MFPTVEIDDNVYNPVFMPYLDDQTRTQIFFGGASSGKSVFLAQRCVEDILKGDRNYLVVRNTGKTHRISTYNEICKVIYDWDLRRFFEISKSELTITCANGFQILFVGLDDVEKIKSIIPQKGVITDMWLEEATEDNYDDYKQLQKRLRGISKVKKRITMSFNPIMRTHWICQEFFKGFNDGDRVYRDGDLLILKTTYNDNRFLEIDDTKALENETDEYYYNVYTLGNWGIIGHLIFTKWRVEDLSGIKDKFDYYNNGLDYGFTNDPSAYVRCAKKEKTIYILDGFYEYGLTNNLIADRIKDKIPGYKDRKVYDKIYCDSAEPKSIAELKQYGINAVESIKGPGSVNYGIQFLQQYEIVIDRSLQEVINEFQMYQWKKNRDGQITNEPVEKNNHAIDALRYAYSDQLSEGGPRVRWI